jgi:hypothetical protein
MNEVHRISNIRVGGKRDDWQVGVGVVTRAGVEPKDWRENVNTDAAFVNSDSGKDDDESNREVRTELLIINIIVNDIM